MFLPWINLVPSEYGTYASFDASQEFRWRGRTSQYHKIALSSLFMAEHPDFFVHEGNHSVSTDFTSPALEPPLQDGLTILHIPVRSLERFKYKIGAARRLLVTKHNRLASEGTHVDAIDTILRSGAPLTATELNTVAANYGDVDGEPVDVAGWPRMRLPEFVRGGEPCGGPPQRTLSETLLRETETSWSSSEFVPGVMVTAKIEGPVIEIVPQPMRGDGTPARVQFSALPTRNSEEPARFDPSQLSAAMEATFSPVRLVTFSAWSELVPTMFGLFSLLRPRRFVELGSHYGMSYFAACQASEGRDFQCVAIDNWIGDPHASFHSKEVFDQFKGTLKTHFPNQLYIRANFSEAAQCFDDRSIDLLHIDGYHTYEAVRTDFETWLPKMSDEGVIIFHDINVHERGFGVWRFWGEVTERYPFFSLMHCHGLGMLYVGREPSPAANMMRWLQANSGCRQILQSFLEQVGTLSLQHRRQADEIQAAGSVEAASRVASGGPPAPSLPSFDPDGRHQEVLKQLYDARRRPMRTWLRHLKWKTNRAIDKLPLSRKGHERTRRRIEKSAPGAL